MEEKTYLAPSCWACSEEHIFGGSYNDKYSETQYHVSGNAAVTIGKSASLLLNEGGLTYGLSACSRTLKTPEDEKGTVILQDERSDNLRWATSSWEHTYANYHYIVKASTGGKVYSAGASIRVVPESGYIAIVKDSSGNELTVSSTPEGKEDGTYYTLPPLGSDSTKTINVTFSATPAE